MSIFVCSNGLVGVKLGHIVIEWPLDERDMRIYYKVSVTGFCVTRSSLNIVVKFKTIKPVKNWEKTSHFMFGNLICLSPRGNFEVNSIKT